MTAHEPDEPIEAHLDELLRSLLASPGADVRDVRRTLTEVEAHLRDSAAEHEAGGLDPAAAARAAVADFGPVSAVSASTALSLRDLVRPGALLVAVGLLAIGASGLLAELMGRLWGARFVAGDLPGATYTPERCADFREYFPGHDCASAAALHHWGEVVDYRVAAGVLGLVVLVAWRLLPRRRPLPTGYAAVVGVAVFGPAALALGAETLDASVAGGPGAGQWLSAALASGAVAVAFAARLTELPMGKFREVRTRATMRR